MVRKLCLLVVAGLFSFAVQAQKGQDNKIAIGQRIADLSRAMVAKDSAALSELLSEDVTYGHTNGMIQTKAEFIRSVMSGEQDYQSFEVDSINVKTYGISTIVNAHAKAKLLFKGSPLDLNMKMLLVWIKKNSKWILVARQTVKTVG